MRNAPHVWKRFWSLRVGDWFFIRPSQLAVKVGIATYQEHGKECSDNIEDWGKQTPRERISPWRRVKTTRLVKGSKSHPIPVKLPIRPYEGPTGACVVHEDDFIAGKYWPRAKPHTDAMTHFVGDDCPGGHRGTAQTGCGGTWKVAEIQTENQQSMNIDHTPEKPPEHERTGPAC